MGLKTETDARAEKIENLREMFLALADTVARQGVAM